MNLDELERISGLSTWEWPIIDAIGVALPALLAEVRAAREWLRECLDHDEASEEKRPRGSYDYQSAFDRIDRAQATYRAIVEKNGG